MIPGYARTSTIDQTTVFEAQLKEFEGVKCEKIFRKQTSSVAVRAQLEERWSSCGKVMFSWLPNLTGLPDRVRPHENSIPLNEKLLA